MVKKSAQNKQSHCETPMALKFQNSALFSPNVFLPTFCEPPAQVNSFIFGGLA